MTHDLGFNAGQVPVIQEFQGEYRWLSNFWSAPINRDGIHYPSVEHAFQAAKTLDWAHRWEVAQLNSPVKAKALGRIVPRRKDWEDIKKDVMFELLIHKFVVHPDLHKKLMDTGQARLIEGNKWGDTYWGVCNGVGKNHLGLLLERTRHLLRR